jgi:hypothetical protein
MPANLRLSVIAQADFGPQPKGARLAWLSAALAGDRRISKQRVPDRLHSCDLRPLREQALLVTAFAVAASV